MLWEQSVSAKETSFNKSPLQSSLPAPHLLPYIHSIHPLLARTQGRVCAESAENTSYDENWEHVSRKGKSNVTRGQEDVQGGRTLTSQIFGGALQSTVKAARAKASVTVQPFNLLHLDINSSNNVTAALQMLTIAEDIHGEFALRS